MRSTCEALIHAVVVGPIVLFAAVIDAAYAFGRVLESTTNRLAGVSQPPPAGMDEAGMV
jgi:hypothetical protein